MRSSRWRVSATRVNFRSRPVNSLRAHMRLGRVVTITLSIALIGAIIGGVMGMALGALLTLSTYATDVLVVEAASGAAIGAVLAPIAAWVFLRRVSLGKALVQTTIGTTVGAAIGLLLDKARWTIEYRQVSLALVGALIGFLAAAIRLRFFTRTTGSQPGIESTGPGAGS